MAANLETVKKYLFRAFLVLVVCIFLVAGFVVVSNLLNKKKPSYRPLPEKNLFSVNAEIVKVDVAAKKINAKAIVPPDWKKEWTLVINPETKIGTLEGWQKALLAREEARKQKLNSAEQEAAFNKNFKRLSLSSLKVGDTIYVTADDDFAQNSEIRQVKLILWQKL